MKLLFAVAASTLVSVSLAAAAGGPIESCPVKAGPGPYGYDPATPTGPQHWGTLTPDYSMCVTGQQQSPVDYPTNVTYGYKSAGPMPMMKGNAPMDFSPGSYNFAMNCVEGGDCGHTMFNGKKFNIVNIHFHSPSEFYLGGKQFPLEAHIVHASEDGQLAVIATMFDYPDMDSYSSQIYNGVPIEHGKNALVGQILAGITADKPTFDVDLSKIIKPNKGYCALMGSLTTPPCSEGVTFFMAMNVEMVSKRQVVAYRQVCGVGMFGNARPLQPLNGRDVKCYVK